MKDDALALIKEQDQTTKELTEENKRLTSEVSVKKKLLKRCSDLVETIQANTVREMQTELSIHLGTYTKNTTIKVCDLFKLVDEIADKILNKNTEDDLK